MSEWWTYRLEDFLLFSPRVYWRMFELHNAALWPLQLVTLAAGVFMVLLVAAAAAWPWALDRVHPRRDLGLRRLVLSVEPLRDDQLGGRLCRAGFCPSRPCCSSSPAPCPTASPSIGVGPPAWAGYLLLAFALAAQPLLAPLQGRAWTSAEIFGIAPDPTAIGTLGLLLLARGRLLPLLLPIPLLWCLLSGITLCTLGAPEAWAPFAAAALTLAALIATTADRRG